MNKKYTYYDDEGNIQLDEIQDELKYLVGSNRKQIYERLILIENLSNDTIFELFKNDTKNYNNLEDKLIQKLINYIVVTTKKEDNANAFMELVEILKSGYTIDKDEFENEYDYYSNFITTNISTLKDMDSRIEVEIDLRNGKLNFFLDDDSLEELVNKGEEEKK